MMHKLLRKGALLAGALSLTLGLAAQEANTVHVGETSVAAVLDFQHSQVAESGTPGFWLKGGSAEAAVSLWRGLGIAADFTGEHASSIRNGVNVAAFDLVPHTFAEEATGVQNGVNFGKIVFMAGPRYSFDTSKYLHHPAELFTEALFGSAHAFDSVFPSATGLNTTASSFSMQIGGGLDIAMAKHFSLRAPEMDWVHTTLPNAAADTQNEFRIAFGIIYRR